MNSAASSTPSRDPLSDTGVMRILCGDGSPIAKVKEVSESVDEYRPCPRCQAAVNASAAVCTRCQCYVGIMPQFLRSMKD